MAKSEASRPKGDSAEPQHKLVLAREELKVGKRKLETGRVRVKKLIRERKEMVRENLLRQEVDVQRVPVDRMLEGSSQPRYEGDVLVIPVVEEILVVQKQLRVKEELRIRQRAVKSTHRQPVVLRREEAIVERDRRLGNGDAGKRERSGTKRSTQQRRS